MDRDKADPSARTDHWRNTFRAGSTDGVEGPSAGAAHEPAAMAIFKASSDLALPHLAQKMLRLL
jgi:hypothetical protein